MGVVLVCFCVVGTSVIPFAAAPATTILQKRYLRIMCIRDNGGHLVCVFSYLQRLSSSKDEYFPLSELSELCFVYYFRVFAFFFCFNF